jgi:hypothetical protein
MADILSLIQQVKAKGQKMNDNLGAFASSNQTFKDTLLTNLKNIQDTLAKINFQDLGNNRLALLEANKNLEATKLQLQEKQQQLADVNKTLETSRQETEQANKNLQDITNRMQELERQNRDTMEQMQKQQQLALEEARNASLKEQQDMRQQFEQERAQLQSEFDKQRADMEQEKNQAQLATQDAAQKLSQLEASQSQIQDGLNEIDTLLDNQLRMIEGVVNSTPSAGDLNNLVEVIQANLVAGINMLSETRQTLPPPPPTSQRGFILPPTLAEFRNLQNEQARRDFYKVIPQNNANELNRLIRDGALTEAENLYQNLLQLYNQRYGRTTGGKRRTKKRVYGRKLRRKTAKHHKKSHYKQKAGYTYGKEDETLRKSSSIVSDSGSSKTSSSLKNSILTSRKKMHTMKRTVASQRQRQSKKSKA